MKAVPSKITKCLPVGTLINTCDNSGAKVLKIFTVMGAKTVKRRYPTCGVGDLVMASVVKGRPDMRKQIVFALIVRQKKEFRRKDGTRVKFEDNAAIVLKDEKGNPKGTIFKGPIAREVALRWTMVAKIASIIA